MITLLTFSLLSWLALVAMIFVVALLVDDAIGLTSSGNNNET